MKKLQIITDGTVEGTNLTVDGKIVTKDEKVTSIMFSASSPWKTSNGEVYPGYVACHYRAVDKDGTTKSFSVSSGKDESTHDCGQEPPDGTTDDCIVSYIGLENRIVTIVDKIEAYAKDQKIKIPTREVLLSRSLVSLKDKAEDMGIKLE